MFLILFIQNSARALKDGLVATMIGPETISFLKFWVVFPIAIGSSFLCIKLINTMRPQHIFYLILSLFISFFIFFAFVLYPNYQNLHMEASEIVRLTSMYPHLKWFILIGAKWTFALYYVVIELWAPVVYVFLFWQFVNSITPVAQSIRFYMIFALLGQTDNFFCGVFLSNISNIVTYLMGNIFYNIPRDILFIQTLLSVCIVLGVIVVSLYWFLNNKILSDVDISQIQLQEKETLPFMQSIKLILKSRYILLIVGIFFCYGCAVAIAEGPWKAKVSSLYTTPEAYTTFVGSYLKYQTMMTIILAIIGSILIRKVGWLSAAILGPILIFCFGSLFFLSTNFSFIPSILHLVDPTTIPVLMGTMQVVLAKASKYALLDSVKEMAFVPLPNKIKNNGKSIDGLGTKFGKSMGSLVQTLMFIIVPTASYGSISIYLMFIFIAVCIVWFVVIKLLSVRYNALINENKINNQ